MCAFSLNFARGSAFLILALSIGCTHSRPAKVAVAPTPERQPTSSTALPPQHAAKLTPPEQNLHRMGAELERLTSQPKLGIPDAVLNRTACLVVFPDAQGASRQVQGFASCRNAEGQWTSPVVVNLSSPANGPASDLYLFVLSDRARRKLVAGQLNLGSPLKVAAGPTTQETAILDEIKASEDVFAYSVNGTSLRGTEAPHSIITLDAAETQRLYGHALDTAQLLSVSTMSSTVTSFYRIDVSSFFNTITPAGIIIHHSVLIPSGDLPETERALDRFHYAQGYEVSCFGKLYHIAYHYLILPNGKILSGRPERCEGAHARGYNSYLGIALVGNFSSHVRSRARGTPAKPTKAQLASLVRLCCYLRQKYSIPLQHIMPHNEVSKTECPGDGLEFNTVLAAISRESGAGS